MDQAERKRVVPAGHVIELEFQENPARKKIQSVDRALVLLEYLARVKKPVRLSDISQFLDLNVSTCHHLLSTLMGRGYVSQSTGRTYILGSKLSELAGVGGSQFDLVGLAMDELHQLNADTGETVHLATRQGNELVTLTVLDSHHALRVVSGPGPKLHAFHAIATGKAILAWLPDPVIDRILSDRELKKFTEKTITSKVELIEDLRRVRRHGFAMDDEEFQPGVVCVGAPIRDGTGAVMGSFSCSMPTTRAGKDVMASIKKRVIGTARAISKKLGREEGADNAPEKN